MQDPNPGAMAAHKAIEILGGVVAAARKLQVKDSRYQTVQSWLKTRVPAEYCPTIERATGGQVRCEDLRPDVDWAVLRTSPAANQAGEEVRDAA